MLTGKLNEMIRAINDLDARLTDLKSKHEKLAATRQVAAVEQKPEIRTQTEKVDVEDTHAHQEPTHVARDEHSQHVQAQKKDEYDVNQRTGNFQSQDVAIDKMFYFGNKK
jgi:outer membrane murein-binding lipoprotein Lpp